ncbi:MAG: GNAT family N-acetyltransferase [Chlamydiota bacterium]|nr:GNAT family N-acetyltransferase [Chlamydiota bacterium]
MSLKAELFDSFDLLEGLSEQWNSLLQHTKANTLFLTYEWVRAWWDIYGRGGTLFLVVIKDGDDLIGIAPLYIESALVLKFIPIRQVCFIGDKHVAPCFLNFILEAGRESEIIPLIFQIIKGMNSWDRLMFDEMHESAMEIALMTDAMRRMGLFVLSRRRYACPYQALAGTMREFMQEPDVVFKKITATRHVPKLMKHHIVQFNDQINEEDLDDHINTFISLHNERWHLVGKKSFFDYVGTTKFFRAICHTFYENGCLKMSSLLVDGEIVAMECGVIYSNAYYAYQLACASKGRQYRAGAVLTYHIFESLVGNVQTFHYLRGKETYKYQWGCINQFTKRIEAWRGLLGKTIFCIRFLLRAIHRQ